MLKIDNRFKVVFGSALLLSLMLASLVVAVPHVLVINANDTNNTVVPKYKPIAFWVQWNDTVDTDYPLTTWTYETDLNGTWGNHSWTTFTSASNWTNFTINPGTYVGGGALGKNFTVNVYANNSNGDITKAGPFWFKIDNTAPAGANRTQNVTNNTYICKYWVLLVGGQVSEAEGLGYHWLYNGTANLTATPTPSNRWFNKTYNPSGLPVGTVINLKVYANDSSGNKALMGYWKYTIDNTKPTYTAASLTSNVTNGSTNVEPGTVIKVTAKWTDNLNVSHCWLFNGVSNATATAIGNSTVYGNWTNKTFNTAGYIAGTTYYPKIYCNDTSGNVNVTGKWAFTMKAYSGSGSSGAAGHTVSSFCGDYICSTPDENENNCPQDCLYEASSKYPIWKETGEEQKKQTETKPALPYPPAMQTSPWWPEIELNWWLVGGIIVIIVGVVGALLVKFNVFGRRRF